MEHPCGFAISLVIDQFHHAIFPLVLGQFKYNVLQTILPAWPITISGLILINGMIFLVFLSISLWLNSLVILQSNYNGILCHFLNEHKTIMHWKRDQIISTKKRERQDSESVNSVRLPTWNRKRFKRFWVFMLSVILCSLPAGNIRKNHMLRKMLIF